MFLVQSPARLFRRFYVFCIHLWLRKFVCRPMVLPEGAALVVAPHPDDEALGCGGLIALKRAAGMTVRVVFLTDGAAAAHPDLTISRKDFVQLRKKEAISALEILNVDENCVLFLDVADTSLRNASSSEIAVEKMASLLSAHPPHEVYVPHHRDCHSDHEAAWRITRAAIQRAGSKARLIQYPVWMLWSAPLFWRLFPRHLAGAQRLCIRSVQAQKRRAIAAYTSQCATLPRGFLGQFLGPEEVFFVQNEG